MSRREPTEEELQAALRAQLESVRVDEVIVQVAIDLLNLAAMRAGMGGPDAPPPDFDQARLGIEAVRALIGIVDEQHGDKLGPVKDALSQVQMHYARTAPAAGQPAAPAEGAPDAKAAGGQPEQPKGPSAVQSGRLWVPGS
jgi:ribosomal protein L12E/L44/L45/RPP1/RPP2